MIALVDIGPGVVQAVQAVAAAAAFIVLIIVAFRSL